MRRLDSKFEECECTSVVKRAEKMHHAVDTKIAAQDSRSDSPQHGPTSEQPPTEETPPLKDGPSGRVIVSVPIAIIVIAGVFLIGMGIGQREQPQTVKAANVYQSGPTLADVTRWSLQIPTSEVVEAMRCAARSTDANVARAAQAALLTWGL